MRNSAIFVPFVRDYRSLRRSIENIGSLSVPLFIIDNSHEGIDRSAAKIGDDVDVIRPSIPLTFCGAQNLMMWEARERRLAHYYFAHSDISTLPGFFDTFVAHVEGLYESNPRWGIAFSYYDCLCAFRTDAAWVNGPWDVNLQQYASDNDWYRRMRGIGFEIVNRHTTELSHEASTTINRSPMYHFTTDAINKSNMDGYYPAKWGGKVGHERYDGAHPWGDADVRKVVDFIRRCPVYKTLVSSLETKEGNLLEITNDECMTSQIRFHMAVLAWASPSRILEVGTQKALYGLFVAVHLNHAFITTCDKDPRSAAAVAALSKAYPNVDVEFILGDSAKILPIVSGTFDLAYVDGSHTFETCYADLTQCARLLVPFILVDDANQDDVAQAIQKVAEEHRYAVMPNPWYDERKLTLLYKTNA